MDITVRSAIVAGAAIFALFMLVGIGAFLNQLSSVQAAATSQRHAIAPMTPPTASAADLNKRSNDKLIKEEAVINTMRGTHMFDGGHIEDDQCSLTMDGDEYEEATQQDKSFLVKIFYELCAGSYRFPGRRLPPDGLPFRVYNLAGDEIYSDTIVINS